MQGIFKKMKIDDYNSWIVLRYYNPFNTPLAFVYDYDIVDVLRSTNYRFLFGTIMIYNEKAAQFTVEKTKNLFDCRVEPWPLFLGLKYLSCDKTSKILEIKFPNKMESIKRVVNNMREFSNSTPWRLRIKLRNVVDKFSQQQILDDSRAALTL